MRSRSPSRRSTPPPPPRISRRSPGAFRMRGKSPDRRRRMAPPPGVAKFAPVASRSGSPPRPRRDFRHSPRRELYSHEQMIRPSHSPDFTFPRRSRSPLQRESKVRSYSPGKRKVSPPKRERVRSRDTDRERMRPPHSDMPPPRKRTRSKSRESAPRDASRLGSYGGPSEVSPARTYQGLSGPYAPSGSDREDANRTVATMSERFHGAAGPGGFKKESENPVFRGPDGTGFDINELKKITVDVRRNIPVGVDSIERTIINPEDVVLVRRPGEGSRPIFARDEILQASRVNTSTIDGHRRVVAIVDEAPPVESQGRSLPPADERDNGDYPRTGIARFESPGRYSDAGPRSRDDYYPPPSEREAPPRDYPRPSREYDRPPPSFEQRERSRDDRFDRHNDDLRHELEMRRRDDSRYASQEPRRYDYRGSESGRSPSDLRMRINEKRTDQHDERDSAHHRVMEPYPDSRERDPSRRGMMQPSPPGSDRRRGMVEEFHPMDDRRMQSSGDGRVMHRQGPPERFHHEPPERFHYKSWDSNPEHVPKGRAYFEHDNRGEEFGGRGRGRGMMGRGNTMRGRGMMRGRPFRGTGPPTRGFMGRGNRRGYSPRKPTRRTSPHWEHDLFDKFSTDDREQPSNK